MYNYWERAQRWPGALRYSVTALIPKPGAQLEHQLRPIGVLPYVYRVWMAIRKRHLQLWSQTLHGGQHDGAATLAWRTAVQVELDHWRGALFS